MAKKTAIFKVDLISDAKRFRKGFRQAERTAAKFSRAMGRLTKSTAAVGAFTLIGASALAATSNVAAFTASLGALGGLILPTVGILVGFGVGLLATYLALKDTSKELEHLGPKFTKLQKTVSSNFWDKAKKPIEDLVNTTLPALTSGFGTVGTSLGEFFGEMASSIQSAADNTSLQVFFDRVAESIDIAKDALQPFVNGIKDLGGFGSEYLAPLADWFVRVSESFEAFASKARADGSLKQWTENGLQAARDLGGVLSGLGGIMAGIASAAAAAGGSPLGAAADGLKRVADIVQGPAFQGALTTLFEGAHEAMEKLTPAIKAIGDGFVTIAPTLAELMPTVAELVSVLATTFVPVIADLIAGMLPLVETIHSNKEAFLGIMGAILLAAGSARAFRGALSIAQGGMVAFGAVKSGVQMVGRFRDGLLNANAAASVFSGRAGTLGGKVAAFAAAMGRGTAALIRNTGAMVVNGAIAVALAAKTAALTVARWAAVAAQTALNIAMALNPIALIIIAVVALIAGFVLLYNKVEWFRVAVDTACAWIANAWTVATTWITNAWNTAMQWIGNAVLNFVAGAVNKFLEFRAKVNAVIEFVRAFFKAKFQQMKQKALEIIVGIIVKFLEFRQKVIDVVNKVKSFFVDGFNSMKSTAKGVIDSVVGFFDNIISKVKGAIDWVRNLFNMDGMPGWMSGLFGGGTGFEVVGSFASMPQLATGMGATGISSTIAGSGSRGSSVVVVHNYHVTNEFRGVTTDKIGVANEIEQLLENKKRLKGGF
ncbi:phage tail protein [Zhihengliuella halotolerans]|uniref:Phage-related protein n=1 Tax=Zhihengliuella halotolerans TaxID=370736 RepID=A0A4Q8ACJ5_9MICC|nr:hypothetical protein [Zhihengliuella halotolerans]RZU61451.1 hypothetical protein EV380_1021 [Zhihengliuella halotolerans]